MSSPGHWRHLAAAGIIVAGAGAIQLAGGLLELARLGASDDAAYARIEHQVTQRFDTMATALEALAVRLAARPTVIAGLRGDPNSAVALFDAVRAAPVEGGVPTAAITVYDDMGAARAWTGRPSEIAIERILGGQTFLIAPGSLGLRLVYVEPLFDAFAGASPPPRIGSIAAELVLSPALGVTGTPAGLFNLSTPIADVAVRAAADAGAGSARPADGGLRFDLLSPRGDPLLEASVAVTDLRMTRIRWRRTVSNLTLLFVALAVVGAILLALRRMPRGGAPLRHLGRASLAVAGLGAAGLLLRAASTPEPGRGRLFGPEVYSSGVLPDFLRSPADLVIYGALAVALVLVAAVLLQHARPAARRLRRSATRKRLVAFLLIHAVGGTALAAITIGLHAVTRDAAFRSTVDLLHTSFAPWDAGRIALLCGLILAAVGTVWGGVLVLAATRTAWRHPRRQLWPLLGAIIAWGAPGAAGMIALGQPLLPGLILPAGTMLAALSMPAVQPRFRHASQASRVLVMLLALVAPALLLYPTLSYHADRAKRQLVETRYAREAARHPADLQRFLNRSLGQIDEVPELHAVTSAPARRPGADRAFSIWRQTDLAQLRLTSAIELYDAGGSLISRFALNFPEYTDVPQRWVSGGCDWEIFGEAAPFGSEERRILHGERAICAAGPTAGAAPIVQGSVVVHLALDYQALPFISPRNPYVELLRERPGAGPERQAGRDVELVIYGWGLQPIFTSGSSPWIVDDELFERIFASREPFWTTRVKGGSRYDVYVVNNRAGIYALGYPAFGLFDHLVRLVEITALVGLGWLVLLLAAVCVTPWTTGWSRFGRDLLRDIRTSFYRRLFLAFVAATVIPVLALALVIRIYLSAQLRADIETGAARTATVAQRVIEESFGLQQAGEEPAAIINDDLLVFISQVIDQDVNIFEGSQLLATSERDLFASGLLPTRTPAGVYDAIVLRRVSGYVAEDEIGDLQYLVAATPIRAGGRDAILTVPLTSRQQEIEDQIAGLDRGILIGVALFVLLGAASGYYLAERIADPVKRLTRATRRIARGDFDAQVAVKSADELQRLMAAFNRMAIDLKDQQRRLERTHRLEAWGEMARQVAHEIKNPLTPVQLSAEHLLRVNRDRGEPLGPVLKHCVDSILAQVRILRQIASEFSSYASSPTVNREETDLGELLQEVVAPYRPGLDGRIVVTIDIERGLPFVSVDRTLVARALTNVIDNALHAMPGEGSLEVHATAQEAAVLLVVRDTGVGIDETTLRRIFEPYFSTKVSGTGLGMAIAKRNVDLSGGTIGVNSTPHEGTVVRIAFAALPSN